MGDSNDEPNVLNNDYEWKCDRNYGAVSSPAKNTSEPIVVGLDENNATLCDLVTILSDVFCVILNINAIDSVQVGCLDVMIHSGKGINGLRYDVENVYVKNIDVFGNVDSKLRDGTICDASEHVFVVITSESKDTRHVCFYSGFCLPLLPFF